MIMLKHGKKSKKKKKLCTIEDRVVVFSPCAYFSFWLNLKACINQIHEFDNSCKPISDKCSHCLSTFISVNSGIHIQTEIGTDNLSSYNCR